MSKSLEISAHCTWGKSSNSLICRIWSSDHQLISSGYDRVRGNKEIFSMFLHQRYCICNNPVSLPFAK